MDQESCCECKYSNRTYFSNCLTCHDLVCKGCEKKHIQRYGGNHCLRIGFSDYYYKCSKHNELFFSYCISCSELLCNVCIAEIHRQHNVCKVTNIPYESTAKQKGNAEDELRYVKLQKDDIQQRIKHREHNLYELKRQAVKIECFLKEQKNRINTLMSKRCNEFNEWVKSLFQNTPETSELMGQIKILKLNEHIYSELENHLTRALSQRNLFEFAKIYNGILEDRKKIMLTQIPDNNIPELSVDVQVPTEKELMDILFPVTIRRKGQDIDATIKKEEMQDSHSDQAKDKNQMIAELKAAVEKKDKDLTIMTSTIEMMANNVSTLCNAVQNNDSQVLLNFEKQSELRKHPAIEEQCDRYCHQMMKLEKLLFEMKYKSVQTSNEPRKAFVHERSVQTSFVRETEYQERSVQTFDDTRKPVVHGTEYQERQSLEKAELQLNIKNKEVSELKERLDLLTRECNTMKKELQSANNEKEDLKTRLSQVAGAKLISGNSSIADLGDKYRPTKISEMYSDLYDREWTDAFDEIGKTETNISEEVIVRNLFIVLKETFKACHKIAQEQITKLVANMFLDIPNECKTHIVEMKQLKDARKRMAYDVGTLLAKDLLRSQSFNAECKKYNEAQKSLLKRVIETKYAERCVVICWLMVVQDPEMYLDDDLKTGSLVNKDCYREYTKSGEKVAFSVWPALYLHINGPLLKKGVAQCRK